MMRLVCLFFLCVLLFLGPSSFSEISVEEFEKIRTIVKEEVSASEARLRAESSHPKSGRWNIRRKRSQNSLSEWTRQISTERPSLKLSTTVLTIRTIGLGM